MTPDSNQVQFRQNISAETANDILINYIIVLRTNIIPHQVENAALP